MSKLIMKSAIAATFLFGAPLALNAQEEPAADVQEQEVCMATIAPVAAGEVLAVTAAFPAPFGAVTALEAVPETGIVLASDEKIEMAAEEKAEEVEMADDPNVTIFWLDTTAAQPGTYVVILKNEGGDECTAEIEVQEPAGL